MKFFSQPLDRRLITEDRQLRLFHQIGGNLSEGAAHIFFGQCIRRQRRDRFHPGFECTNGSRIGSARGGQSVGALKGPQRPAHIVAANTVDFAGRKVRSIKQDLHSQDSGTLRRRLFELRIQDVQGRQKDPDLDHAIHKDVSSNRRSSGRPMPERTRAISTCRRASRAAAAPTAGWYKSVAALRRQVLSARVRGEPKCVCSDPRTDPGERIGGRATSR